MTYCNLQINHFPKTCLMYCTLFIFPTFPKMPFDIPQRKHQQCAGLYMYVAYEGSVKVRVSHFTQISTSSFVALTSPGSTFISVGAKIYISPGMTVQRWCKIAAENYGWHHSVMVSEKIFNHTTPELLGIWCHVTYIWAVNYQWIRKTMKCWSVSCVSCTWLELRVL